MCPVDIKGVHIYLQTVPKNKGSFINDVKQIRAFSDTRFPLCHTKMTVLLTNSYEMPQNYYFFFFNWILYVFLTPPPLPGVPLVRFHVCPLTP